VPATLALTAPLGYGLAAGLSAASAAGTALLMLHFTMCLRKTAFTAKIARIPASIPRFLPLFALGAIFIPWLLYPAVGDLLDALSPAILWDGLWPVGIGAALALGLARDARLRCFPAGDLSLLAIAQILAAMAAVGRWARFRQRLRSALSSVLVE
jgi:hypothetical protein